MLLSAFEDERYFWVRLSRPVVVSHEGLGNIDASFPTACKLLAPMAHHPQGMVDCFEEPEKDDARSMAPAAVVAAGCSAPAASTW